DATIVAENPAGAPGRPAAPPSGPMKAPVVRPAAGAPAPVPANDDEDATRAQPLPPMNAAVAHPPRPVPQRMPDQPQGPPVVVEARPMPGQRTPQYSPAAFAPTYSPG